VVFFQGAQAVFRIKSFVKLLCNCLHLPERRGKLMMKLTGPAGERGNHEGK
jgi:hypothetical protein